MNYPQKILLKKRTMVESVVSILKTVCGDIEYTRHRSPVNASLNAFARICAYAFWNDYLTFFLTQPLKVQYPI